MSFHRCFLALAKLYSIRGMWDDALRCLEAMRDRQASSTLLAEFFCLARSSSSTGTFSLKAVKKLFSLPSLPLDLAKKALNIAVTHLPDPRIVRVVLSRALDMCKNDHKEKQDLFFLALSKMEPRENFTMTATQILLDFVAWSTSENLTADVARLEHVAKLGMALVKTTEKRKLWTACIKSCEALVFWCQTQQGELATRMQRRFLWHHLHCATECGSFAVVNQLQALHRLRDDDEDFYPFFLDAAIWANDPDRIKTLLDAIVAPKNKLSGGRSILIFLGRLLKASPEAADKKFVLKVVQSILVDEEECVKIRQEQRRTLLQCLILLHLQTGDTGLTASTALLLHANKDVLLSLSDPSQEWIKQALWKMSVDVTDDPTRFRLLLVLAQLVQGVEDHSVRNGVLALQLSTALALLRERQSWPFLEEIRDLAAVDLNCCDTNVRQKRLLVIYSVELLLSIEKSIQSIRKRIKHVIKSCSDDGETLLLVAKLMETAMSTKTIGFAKLNYEVYKAAMRGKYSSKGFIAEETLKFCILNLPASSFAEVLDDVILTLTGSTPVLGPESALRVLVSAWNEGMKRKICGQAEEDWKPLLEVAAGRLTPLASKFKHCFKEKINSEFGGVALGGIL